MCCNYVLRLGTLVYSVWSTHRRTTTVWLSDYYNNIGTDTYSKVSLEQLVCEHLFPKKFLIARYTLLQI